VLCYEAADKRVSPNLLYRGTRMVRFKEEYYDRQKKKAPPAGTDCPEATERSQAAERAALRAEYFRVSRLRCSKTHPGPRLIDG